ncbi:unnamed protein product, partial [Brenthis ino]
MKTHAEVFSNYVRHQSQLRQSRPEHRQSSNCIACIDFSALDNDRHFITPNGVSRAAANAQRFVTDPLLI